VLGEEGLFYRFFYESNLPLALIDKSGALLLVNRRFEQSVESLGVSKQTLPELLRKSGDFTRLWMGGIKRGSFSLPPPGRPPDSCRIRCEVWLIGGGKAPCFGLAIQSEGQEQEDRTHPGEPPVPGRRGNPLPREARFFAALSQELPIPLQTIRDMAGLLLHTPLNREQAAYSQQIRFAVDALFSLAKDMADYSLLEAGTMALERANLNLAQSVEQAADMIALEIFKKGLELAVDIPPDAALIIQGDPDKFRQLLFALLKNAASGARRGGLTLNVRRLYQDTGWEGKEALHIAVAADVGDVEETEETEETEDARAEATASGPPSPPALSRPFEGAGLGWDICRKLAALMGGKAARTGRDGAPAFSITLPLESASARPDPLPKVSGGQDTRILVTDDHAASRHILAQYLKDLGFYHIDSAASAEEALAIMRIAVSRNQPFQLCFLDMLMPRMDGWRLASEINHDKGINAARLVLLIPQGLLAEDAKMTALKWFNGYLYKPVKRRDLAGLIAALGEAPAVDLEGAPEAECAALDGEGREDAGAFGLQALTGSLAAELQTAGAQTPETQTLEPQKRPEGPPAGEGLESAPPGGGADAPVPPKEAEPPPSHKPLLTRGFGLAPLSEPPGKAEPAILVVEDNQVNQKLFSMILEKLGYSALVANDGAEGLAKAAANRVTLVFMDIQMPRLNGYEAIAIMRRLGFAKPVIAVTANNDLEEWDRCIQAGFDDLLVKPFKRPDMEKTLRRWIGVIRENTPPWPEQVEQELAARLKREEPAVRPRPFTSRPAALAEAAGPDILNVTELAETFLGNMEMLPPLIRRFLDRTEKQITQDIPKQLDAKDWGSAGREAHTIKGSALTLAGKELGQLAARLEKALNTGEEGDIHRALPLLGTAFQRFKEAAERFLASREAPAKDL
jgi:CheY-like chemotaxis protein